MLDRYAVRYGIDGADEFEEFVTLMRAMDEAFIEHTTRE